MIILGVVTDIQGQIEDSGFFKITQIGQMGSKGLQAALIIGGVLALAFLIWGAIDWLMSEGNEQKLTSAKSKITHAMIGFALLASVWTIWSLTRHFLGLGGGSGGSSGGTTVNGNCNPADIQRCRNTCQSAKGCTGSNCQPDKNEFGIPGCECAPGPGQSWVQVGNDPWGRCQ